MNLFDIKSTNKWSKITVRRKDLCEGFRDSNITHFKIKIKQFSTILNPKSPIPFF